MLETGSILVLGDEELNPEAIERIDAAIRPGEAVLVFAGFDWQNKVIALTDQRILIADGNGLVIRRQYDGILSATNRGRTLVITTRQGDSEFRMGNEELVATLARLIENPETMVSEIREDFQSSVNDHDNDVDEIEPPNIAERVKFWEEQDKINQELIPRVIRQNELITRHIADHENLPLVAGNAIREALAEAREEQRQQHEAEMVELRAEAEEQRRRHQIELETAREERQQQSEALAETKATAAEQARQHEAELAAAKAEREEQSRQHSNEVTTLQAQLRQSKIQMMLVAGGAVVIAIAGVIIGILV